MKRLLCSITALRWSINKLARVLDDRRGFSLTELLVSCSVLGMVMAAVGGVVTTGSKISTDGDNRAQAQQAARAGMIMEEDLRLAGAGFPPAAVKIAAATSTSVSFWADLTSASTRLTANANTNDTTLSVVDASGFMAGDVIYLINTDQFSTVTVSSAAGTTIMLASPGLPRPYAQGVQVGRPKLVRFVWDNVSTLLKDAGAGTGLQPLATGVTGLNLTYFDTNDAVIPPGSLTASLGNIRRIVVTLTAQSTTGSVDSRTFNLTSSVRPRNL
jgi:prepilin-type N-terminal cleavage/methylation domain-containing protein